MEDLRSLEQDFLALNVIRVGNAAVNGTDRGTLLLVEMSHAFRALFGDDIVEIV